MPKLRGREGERDGGREGGREGGVTPPPSVAQTQMAGGRDGVVCTEELEEEIKVGREGGRKGGREGQAV
jgi:hypothetical protein